MFENLKNMTDEEVISVINMIVTDNMDIELADLKLILAEASGRKLEKKYINIIAERIKAKIQPEPVELKRKHEATQTIPVYQEKPAYREGKNEETKNNSFSKPTFDDVYSSDIDEDEEYEKYPTLFFLTGLFKVFAWILMIGLSVIFIFAGVVFFKDSVLKLCLMILSGVVTGLVSFLILYAAAESIKIKLDIEKHLGEIKKFIKK